jgi:hypothetical protein
MKLIEIVLTFVDVFGIELVVEIVFYVQSDDEVKRD